MIDFSHGNSSKIAQKQIDVGRDIARQVASGEERIFGIMMESHLKAGRQDLVPGKPLQYGVSITDGCVSWEDSRVLLDQLADAVRARRVKAETEAE
jgi:3-deoxy-7-phosphoheptulonate synthase